MAKSANANLENARQAKKDEFYTRLEEIENELYYYRDHFKDKIVFCNCDDPEWSNFWEYFRLQFENLGLKKLIATHYDKDKPTYKLEMTGPNSIVRTDLKQNGDFRSEECIALLDEADIVCTNPPFSLFREYLAQLMAHEKKFLILANINAVTYKEVFPLFMENKIWMGPSIHSGDRMFYVPDSYPLEASGCGVDDETGRKYIRVKGVRWFTNLEHDKRHEELLLWRSIKDDDIEYPEYVNFDGIEIAKCADIPKDYYGIMGVPVTFLDKYNPSQFQILGYSREVATPIKDVAAEGVSYSKGGNAFYIQDSKTTYRRLYGRIIIKRIQGAA